MALDLGGRPKQIRVTDLFEEVAEEQAQREHAPARRRSGTRGRRAGPRAGAGLPPVTTAVVAVCSGDGLAELFSKLGCRASSPAVRR